MSHDSVSPEPSARAGVESVSAKRKRPKTSDPDSAARQFDPMAREVLRRLIRLMALRGLSPQGIEKEVRTICRATSPSKAHDEFSFSISFEDVSHVLTLWYSHPKYVDEMGTPRAVPARGPMPSIEALLAEVNPGLSVDESILFLLQLKALREEEGGGYVPQTRHVSYAGNQGVYFGHSMRILSAVLRTLEHNAEKLQDKSLFEFVATNPRFPKAQLGVFHAALREKAMEFLKHVDGDMFRRELECKEGEPTTRFGVGIYVFEDDPPSIGDAEEVSGAAIHRASTRRVPSLPPQENEPLSAAARLTAALAVRRRDLKR